MSSKRGIEKEKPVKVAPALKVTLMFLLVDSVGCLFCNRKKKIHNNILPQTTTEAVKGTKTVQTLPELMTPWNSIKAQPENQPFAVCDHRFKATGFQQNNHFCPISLTCRHTGISVWLHLKVICDYTPGVNKLQDLYKRGGAEETRRATMILIQGQLLVLKTTESAALKWSRKSLSPAGCELKSRRPAWSPTLLACSERRDEEVWEARGETGCDC